MKVLYLVRHCKAEGQEADANLTIDGNQQVHALANLLCMMPIDYIVSSPYKRAYLSIEPLAVKLGLSINVDERLKERVLAGFPTENWLTLLKATFDDIDLCYEGGESSRQAMNRAVSVIDELLSSEYKNIVISSHGNLVSLILKHFNQAIGFRDWQVISNPDVFKVVLRQGLVPEVIRLWEL